jgi:hypothetical protein
MWSQGTGTIFVGPERQDEERVIDGVIEECFFMVLFSKEAKSSSLGGRAREQ